MSQSASPQDLKKLSEIKELIRQKHYDEARAGLVRLPHVPVAREWLTKLDQIAPAKPDLRVTEEFFFPPNTGAQRSTGTSPAYIEPIQPENPWRLGTNSTNASIGVVTGGIFGLVATIVVGYSFALANNWRSFGQSKWANISYGLAILGIVAAIATLVIPVVYLATFFTEDGPNSWGMMVCGSIGAAFSFNLALAISQLYIQQKAYAAWKRNKAAFIQYRYDFDTPLILGAIIVAVGALLGTGLGYALLNTDWEGLGGGGKETPYFTIRDTSGWVTSSNPDPNACSNYSMECFLQLNIVHPTVGLSAVFFQYPVEQTLTLEYLDGHHWNRISTPNGIFHAQRRLPVTINGQTWVAHEYWFMREGGGQGYLMSAYFSYGNNAFQIDFFTDTPEGLNLHREAVNDLLASIRY